ncbi:MAG: hypothetical protein QGH42_01840 [Kiritimatiellia bacterium]|nr:hypothetical protein [Kiritimatiellia bacterium]
MTVIVLFLGLTSGCISIPGRSRCVLADFKRAPTHDRSSLAEPVIAELRTRIGVSAAELVRLIGGTDTSTVDARGDGVLKYTVLHKNDNWHSFAVTIRDGKVAEISDVEYVIQM